MIGNRQPWRPSWAQAWLAALFVIAAAIESWRALAMVAIGLAITVAIDIWLWSRP